ncbi:HlyD family secretion protein [Siccirubricoccus sp. KC 17139]|uniref:HlyD family secretion protein n=1 Tax=Siccirubricoccus soli TaxID=2899147 RepID=A0ABT1D1F3_9PROT|nr:HlyD family secretion protein [Siccirubricoccus soli]MCO6415714.1 HlyD family secretion protein [Siccirubricoccus soli]MCP2681846.1 HlyD family secretion protein [Siccirubricoccus soli]
MPEGSLRTPAAADAASPAAAEAPRRQRRWLRPVLMLGGILIVLVGAGAAWLNGGRYAGTDDAYVQADKLLLATDVAGIVQRIAVKEGDGVRQGQVLVELDSAPFRHALDQAQAQLRQVALNLASMQADYQRMLRDIAAQEAAVQLAQVQFDRQAQLLGTSAALRANYDQARFGLAQARQQLESLKAQAQVQLAKLGGDAEAPVEQHPDYLEAAAKVAEAQRQLDHTVLRAPFAGVVTQVSTLQPGQYLAAATPAFALVSAEHLWVDALPKETDLTHVRPGDPATVTIDTYPGVTWQGEVESISPASGATFSVLPAQNASGNWVKVVQRIPVRIRVEQKPGMPQLRAGMSAVVSIDTGHERHLSDLF